jgi:NAD(P)-dependent dehydrogenase (short-subunit alcohol dehydrogenase family)
VNEVDCQFGNRMDLQGKVALITGGRRIGAIVAVALAKRGADVALSYSRSRTEAEQVVERVTVEGRRGVAISADLTDPAACDALVNGVVERLGGVDILVNMASLYVQKPFEELAAADFDAVLAVDLRAAFLCVRAALPSMRRRGGGRVINFADWVARSGRPRYRGFLPYYVAKAAVIALTEALALELAADNILVNAIAPGPIVAPPGTSDEEWNAVVDATPLGRWGGQAEIAKVVLGLIDSDFITGETIRVDGGRHLK